MLKIYGIKEISEKTGLSEYTLRYYEKINLLEITRNSISNKREYTEKNLEQIEYIKALKLLGFKLQEIEKYYSLKLDDRSTILKRKEILNFQRERISEQIKILFKANKLIEEKINCIDRILEEEGEK
jgi:DNA-binding transcriptional MerR regulator